MRRAVHAFLAWCVVTASLLAGRAHGADAIYFPAIDNVTSVLVARINAETVRIDISVWYLSERAISIALVNRFNAGVPVRLIGDRVAIFESDPLTKREFYWLASHGIPIRVRYEPSWFPEAVHWKATIFAGQNAVAFGSANYTPFELAPVSTSNYKDETVMVSDDPAIVNAFRTTFDRMWNDATVEPGSRIATPPYFKSWYDVCRLEAQCADYWVLHPYPRPMTINTARLEPEYPSPPDLIWSQGPRFNQRLVQEIAREPARIDLVAYRLTESTVADALIQRFRDGVAVRVIIEPEQYMSRTWPEYWLTHAHVDRLWAAGIPIRQRAHAGLTHMKMLVTSQYATNASSNIAAHWQRDHNYFVPAATKPAVYQAMRQRFETMWNGAGAFVPFVPQPPDPAMAATPPPHAMDVGPDANLVWHRAPFATSYDVYVGTSPDGLSLIGNVAARLADDPPLTYSWSPGPLRKGTTYYWQIVSRTFAGQSSASPVWSFQTQRWTSDLVVNFGTGGGVWRFDDGRGWDPLHPLSPKATARGDIDGNGIDELVMDFNTGGGVWILWNNAWWSQLHSLTAVRMAVGDLNGNGRADVVLHFAGAGIFIWSDGATWSFLHPYEPGLISVGNIDGMAGDDLVVDFPGRGVWVYWNSSSWSQIHELDVNLLVVAQLNGRAGSELILGFPGFGIYQYSHASTWARLHSLNPRLITTGDLDADPRDDLVLDFNTGGGIWVLLNGSSWIQVHDLSSDGIVLADVDGNGRDAIVVDFGSAYGLWMLVDFVRWEQLHPLSPVDLTVANFN